MNSLLEQSVDALLQSAWPNSAQNIALLPGFRTAADSPAQLRSLSADLNALWHAMHADTQQIHLHAHTPSSGLEQLPFFAIAQAQTQSFTVFNDLIDRIAAHFQLSAALMIQRQQPEHSYTLSFDHALQLHTQQHSAHAVKAFFQLLLPALPENTAAVLADEQMRLPEPQTNLGRLARLQSGKLILQTLSRA